MNQSLKIQMNWKYCRAMFKLALYFFVVLYQSIFFQCQNHQFDVEWDQKLMKIDKAFKCGIENKYKKGSKARVINGKMATNIRYPWMAEILRLVFNPKESDQRGTESYTGTGSIISHKAILTAAHNLCHWPIEEKEKLCCWLEVLDGKEECIGLGVNGLSSTAGDFVVGNSG